MSYPYASVEPSAFLLLQDGKDRRVRQQSGNSHWIRQSEMLIDGVGWSSPARHVLWKPPPGGIMAPIANEVAEAAASPDADEDASTPHSPGSCPTGTSGRNHFAFMLSKLSLRNYIEMFHDRRHWARVALAGCWKWTCRQPTCGSEWPARRCSSQPYAGATLAPAGEGGFSVALSSRAHAGDGSLRRRADRGHRRQRPSWRQTSGGTEMLAHFQWHGRSDARRSHMSYMRCKTWRCSLLPHGEHTSCFAACRRSVYRPSSKGHVNCAVPWHFSFGGLPRQGWGDPPLVVRNRHPDSAAPKPSNACDIKVGVGFHLAFFAHRSAMLQRVSCFVPRAQEFARVHLHSDSSAR